jgi:hypothetical protein
MHNLRKWRYFFNQKSPHLSPRKTDFFEVGAGGDWQAVFEVRGKTTIFKNFSTPPQANIIFLPPRTTLNLGGLLYGQIY